jgi:hypothetical protein
MVQDDDPELDAMLDKILRGEGDGTLASQASMGPQFFAMDMGSGTPGKHGINHFAKPVHDG